MESGYQDRGRSSFDSERRNITPSNGQKRLFSNRHSRQVDEYEDAVKEQDDHEVQSGKRHRTADWPLPATTPSSRPSHRRQNPTASPLSPGDGSQRPSRFMEGSMNDRVSQKPPAPYTGVDDMLEDEHNRGRRIIQPHRPQLNEETLQAARPDAPRSSLYRFGKSIASSFNPNNWKMFKAPTEKDERAVEEQVLRERQEKAVRLYQELKESGHFRDTAIGADFYEPIEVTPKEELEDHMPDQQAFGSIRGRFRSLSRGRGRRANSQQRASSTTRDEKRQGKIYLEPPRMTPSIRGESPASRMSYVSESATRSQPGTPNKPKFGFKKPSLSNIRNSFSTSTNSLVDPDQARGLRRVPSRKDFQKQQKLVKRVSNLESKLDLARRQLNETIGDPAIHETPEPERGRSRNPRKFVPGGLSTLLSERLLTEYVEADAQDGGVTIGQAVSSDKPVITHPTRGSSLRRNSFNGSNIPIPPGRSRVPSVDRLPSVEFGESAVGSKVSKTKVAEPEIEPRKITRKPVPTAQKRKESTPDEESQLKPAPPAKKRRSAGKEVLTKETTEVAEESAEDQHGPAAESVVKKVPVTGGVRCDSCTTGKHDCYIESGSRACRRCAREDNSCGLNGKPMPKQTQRNYYYAIVDEPMENLEDGQEVTKSWRGDRRAIPGSVKCDACTTKRSGCYFEAGDNACSKCAEKDRPCSLNGKPMPIQARRNYHYFKDVEKSSTVNVSAHPITKKPAEPSRSTPSVKNDPRAVADEQFFAAISLGKTSSVQQPANPVESVALVEPVELARPASAVPKAHAFYKPEQKVTPTKKRGFLGYADDGGEYNPDDNPSSPEHSESEEDLTSDSAVRPNKLKKTPPKSIAQKKHTTAAPSSQRPHKIQKTSPTSGPAAQPKRTNSKTKSTTKSNRLSKSKIPNLQHPHSPGPSADFGGLIYVKPSSQKSTTGNSGPMVREDTAEQYEGDVDEYGIPPVPPLPNRVRLPSGEMIDTASAAAQVKGGSVAGKAGSVTGSRAAQAYKGKLAKSRSSEKTKKDKENAVKTGDGEREEADAFQWPEDVF